MKKMKFFITIAACLLITVIGIVKDTCLFQLTVNLIVAIILFYTMGSIIEIYLKKKVFSYDNNIDDKESSATEDKNENND